jgi:hypothetical protein
LVIDVGTFTGASKLSWAHTLDLRPIFCGPKFVHVQVMHVCMRGSVHVLSRKAGRLLDIGFSSCLHNCTSIRRVCFPRPSTTRQHRKWYVVCTRIYCHVLGNTTKKHRLGTYWASGAVDLECKHPCARIAGFEACASPGVKNGGEHSKNPSTGLNLARGKWHGTMPSWGMKWATL